MAFRGSPSCDLPARPSLSVRGIYLLMGIFAGLSALDMLLTWWLLETPGDCFYEANPLAGWVLKGYGWAGMGLFKLACAGSVLGAIVFLRRHRPTAARRVLALGCPVLGLVVGYSVFLLLANRADCRDLHKAHDRTADLTVQFHERENYKNRLYQMARAIAVREISLAQATRELQHYLTTIRYDALYPLRVMFDDIPDEACLAAALIREVGFVVADHPHLARKSLLPPLRADFGSIYGQPLPASAVETYNPAFHVPGYVGPAPTRARSL
ncbi:MAG: hypothetical protein IT429_16060 [Gemmataceae bacterium]|nr:hypothetical protein [Gemmataceae bacterium]